ncbi:MAG: acyl-CoA thioesterase [Chthoniobacterales bacterium]
MNLFKTILWGNTVALSWMWGLGLFFSVQFTSQFGILGLLMFAIPNFLGLMAFGLVTQRIANRQPGSESLASFFTRWARPFRLVFFLYQILAITLTIFAFIHYVWQPLDLQPAVLFLPLTLLIVLAAAILFGEEFDIRRIKYSHGVLFAIAFVAILILIFGRDDFANLTALIPSDLPADDLSFWGYVVPICVGFLVGPWLDLQQWQRAIQMHRERVSIAISYVIGSSQFFALLLFHGALTLWALDLGAARFIRTSATGHTYGQDLLMRVFYEASAQAPWIFGAYCVFVSVCVLTTLDSGYIALRWFLQSNVKASNHPIFSLIPTKLITSPIPALLVCGIIGLASAVLGLELEYFMIFYGTFFVGYATLGIVRCFLNSPANAIPQIKMFSIGSLAVVIFAFGYFLRNPLFQMIGSLLPLAYILWLLLKPGSSEEFVADEEDVAGPAERAIAPIATSPASPVPAGSAAVQPTNYDLGGHFEDKWFVHRFIATYADTNSVGNVYFGMYAMWVGKTRELFFNKVMPKFNLENTPFYILTRSFEHKFMRETKEFETVSVRIRIGSFNRKFVTLEHEIHDSQDNLLGRGKQSLLFVTSDDYKMIDIPHEVHSAFVVHT